MKVLSAIVLCALAVSASDLGPAQRKLNADSFEYAWKTIRDKMWEPMPAGVNWQQIHDDLLPKVQSARTMAEARAIMRDMISHLRLTHFNIVPADVYDAVGSEAKGDGDPGFDLRILDGEAVVTKLDPGSPADKAGVRPGWSLLSIAGKPVDAIIKRVSAAYAKATTRELILTRAVLAALSGPAGAKVKVEFSGRDNQRVPLELELTAPRGGETKFGFLPAQHVYFETRKIANSAYIHFNMFLDPARLSAQFGDAIQSCAKCDGVIIDLRGNPGGLGAMAMGMAGWFINDPNKRLGVMKMKGSTLNFVVFPKAETFDGPVVMLTDSLTGSTSEIFAGGMKDLGRARIIGTRSAGAALPSMFEKLPNGDGFQYAIANYISEGGQPLEGIGVIPDLEVKLTRQALLDGHDPAIDAATAWIHSQKDRKQ